MARLDDEDRELDEDLEVVCKDENVDAGLDAIWQAYATLWPRLGRLTSLNIHVPMWAIGEHREFMADLPHLIAASRYTS